ATPAGRYVRTGIAPMAVSASTFVTAPICGGVGVDAGRVSRKSWRASFGDSVWYAGRPELMTSSMTAFAWGSRAMALSCVWARADHYSDRAHEYSGRVHELRRGSRRRPAPAARVHAR